MKIIIPAKASSTRVVNKNWRPFWKDLSLVDITIKKLKAAGVKKSNIFVSSEDTRLLLTCKRNHGIETLFRSPALCDNDAPLTTVIRDICLQVGGVREVGWAQVTSPTFNEYRACLDKWTLQRTNYDSLAVAFKSDKYLLMRSGDSIAPMGWSFGSNHVKSQNLSCFYAMPFTFSILTRDSLNSTGYYVGRNTLWHIAKDRHIDIDDAQDYADAQAVYAARMKRERQDVNQRSKTQLAVR
jgi:CMP-N-acetylneuraminic acid synthetase